MLAVFFVVLVDEWEEVDDFAVEGFTIERGIIITAIESDVAFDVAIVEVEFAVLFNTGVCADETDEVRIDVDCTVVFVIVNAHRESAVISNSCAIVIFDFAVYQGERAVIRNGAIKSISAEV